MTDSSDSGMGMGMIIGILVVLMIVLFLIFGRGFMGSGGGTQNTGGSVSVPEQVDVNVNPQGQ